MTKKRVILFKKQDTNDQYNELLLKNDYIPQFIPVLDHKSENVDIIKDIIFNGPCKSNYTGLILTSQRSVQAMNEAIQIMQDQQQVPSNQVIKQWNELPMYIVGPQTANALHELPILFNNNGHINDKQHWIIAPRAAELIGLLISDQQRLSSSKLLFLAGDKRRDLIPDNLQSVKLEYHEIQSYVTCSHNDLPGQIGNLPASADWMVYFSPSGLKFILSSIDAATKNKFLATSVNQTKTKVAAIGPTTADYIKEELGLEPHVMAEKPDAQHLIDAIIQSDCKKDSSLEE